MNRNNFNQSQYDSPINQRLISELVENPEEHMNSNGYLYANELMDNTNEYTNTNEIHISDQLIDDTNTYTNTDSYPYVNEQVGTTDINTYTNNTNEYPVTSALMEDKTNIITTPNVITYENLNKNQQIENINTSTNTNNFLYGNVNESQQPVSKVQKKNIDFNQDYEVIDQETNIVNNNIKTTNDTQETDDTDDNPDIEINTIEDEPLDSDEKIPQNKNDNIIQNEQKYYSKYNENSFNPNLSSSQKIITSLPMNSTSSRPMYSTASRPIYSTSSIPVYKNVQPKASLTTQIYPIMFNPYQYNFMLNMNGSSVGSSRYSTYRIPSQPLNNNYPILKRVSSLPRYSVLSTNIQPIMNNSIVMNRTRDSFYRATTYKARSLSVQKGKYM